MSPLSLIEHPSFLLEQPELLSAPARTQDPSLRALKVLHFYLGALFSQFGTISPASSTDQTFLKRDRRKKKPLNPFLGELFLGHTQASAESAETASSERTDIVCEQVSHHPPVTAYRILNDNAGVELNGYHMQRTYFSGTIRMERLGHWLIRLKQWDEDWVVTFPKVHLEGMLPPPPTPECSGTAHLSSSNGFTISVTFSGKGWLRGKKNSFAAEVSQLVDGEKLKKYTVNGQWCGGSYTVRDGSDNVIETIDTVTPRQTAKLVVRPLSAQDPMESRRAWQHVIRGIKTGDMGLISREKNKLEEEQRALRKKEQREGIEWQTRYFGKVGSWPEAEKLLSMSGAQIESERTKGIWRWKGSKLDVSTLVNGVA